MNHSREVEVCDDVFTEEEDYVFTDTAHGSKNICINLLFWSNMS